MNNKTMTRMLPATRGYRRLTSKPAPACPAH